MIRWVVGDSCDKRIVAKSLDGLEKLHQPVTVSQRVESREVELEVGADVNRFKQFSIKKAEVANRRVLEEEKWTVQDRDGRVRFTGQPIQVDAGCWFVVREVVGSKGKEYSVSRVDKWIGFSTTTVAQQTAPDLETSEKLMKEARIKSRSEFNDYLKQKRLKAEENGLAVASSIQGIGGEEGETSLQKRIKRKKLVLKRLKRGDEEDMDVAESSVAYLGIPKDAEGQWEGEEAFSDDDEALFEDSAANANAELDIEVSDDDVEKDKTASFDYDEAQTEELFKDAFGDEIVKIIHDEYQKEHVADDDLDSELKKFGNLEEEDETDIVQETPASGESASKPPASAPSVSRKTSKEEQVRARIKGMFWRSEYKLKLKDILAQFPGLNRTSEEYQYLTKALKDLAEVKEGVLHLKPQYRK